MSSNKTLFGLKWSFIDNIAQQLINFIVSIILARLLSPAEFGLVGMITIFIAISIAFMDGGLNEAIVNKQNATEDDYNTVFWSNILFSIIVYLILFFSAPYIASFFDESSLTILLRIGGLNIILLAVSSIQRSLFVKQVNFKSISLVSLISVMISGITAIVIALFGGGVMSLIVRIIMGQFITTIIFYIISSWRPKFVFNIHSFKSLYKYGVNLFFSRLLNVVQNNIYPFIIGKMYNPIQLGYYTRADSFKSLASTNISNTIQRVSFSVLSNITDKNRQIGMFNKLMTITLLITSFCMTILYVNSRPIVVILLGEKWLDVIFFLKILAISGLFIPVYNMNLNFLAVIRKTRMFLGTEIFSKILLIPTVIVGLYTSIEVFLWAIVIYSIFIYILSFFAIKRYMGIHVFEQIYSLLKISIPILLSWIYYICIGRYLNDIWAYFAISIIMICVFFAGITYIFFGDIFRPILTKK